MKQLKNNLKYTWIISILSGVLLLTLIGYLYYNQQNKEVLIRQHNIHIDEKKSFYKEVTPAEVPKFKSITEKNIKKMLAGDKYDHYATSDGNFFMRKLFIETGKPPIREKETKTQKADYYKNFGFELNNVGVKAVGNDEWQVVGDLKVTYNNREIYTNLVSFNLNSDYLVKDGEFYART